MKYLWGFIAIVLLLSACAPREQEIIQVPTPTSVYPLAHANDTIVGTSLTYENFLTSGIQGLFSGMYSSAYIYNDSGVEFLVVPWYRTSYSCMPDDLKADKHVISPSYDGVSEHADLLMVTDEFSVALQLAAISGNERLVRAGLNTLAQIPSKYGILPAWKVHVTGHEFVTLTNDSATDADMRIIRALLEVSEDVRYSSPIREEAQSIAVFMLQDHLEYQYTIRNATTANSQWIAAGPTTTQYLKSVHMFGGYFGDIAETLRYASQVLDEPSYLQDAQVILSQFLLAANATEPNTTSVPFMEYIWDFDNPQNSKPVNPYYDGVSNPATDTSDAPRMFILSRYVSRLNNSGYNVSFYPYQRYIEWNRAIAKQQSVRSSPKQFYKNGTAFPTDQDTNWFSHGLMLPVYELENRELWDDKVGEIAKQFDMRSQKFYSQKCPGMYQNGITFVNIAAGLRE